MSYNSTIKQITEPVGIKDLQQCFGLSDTDLGTLIAKADINKWAKYKPIKVAKIEQLKYSEVANAKFGLIPAQNELLGTYGDGATGSVIPSADTLEAVLNANEDWTYQRPSGGALSPYRLTDFCEPSDKSDGYGYYHNTPQPLSNVSDWGINMSDIYKCIDADFGYESGTESWKVNANSTVAAAVYSGLSFRFGSFSYDNVGGMDVKAIPLNDLLGIMNTAEYWRLAIAVQVPRSGGFQTMRFFSSRWAFISAHGQSNSPALVLPTISTNQTLCSYINEYATYLKTVSGRDIIGNTRTSVENPTFKLPACLCIIKGMFLDRDGGTRNHCKLSSNSQIYSPPSSMSRFEIIVTDDKNYKGIEAYKYAGIIIASTGQYVQMGEESWKRHEIRRLVFIQKKLAPSGTVINYYVKYSYVTGYNGNTVITTTDTKNGSVELASTSGNSVSRVLAERPSLSISEYKLNT